MIDTSALREKVLDLAIRGKLVPQDPNDEPASVLLERIRAEKEQMVKDGKLKAKDIKNDTIIFKGEDNLHYEKFSDGTVKCIEDEIPFDVPDGWCWTRIGNISSVRGGKRIPKGMSFADEKTSHAYIRVTDMKNHTVNMSELKYITEDVFAHIKNYIVSKNDLYITIAGTIGAVGEIPDELEGMNLTENAVRVTDICINKSFLCLMMQSNSVQKQFKYKTYQVAMPKLGLERILTTLVPVCSLNTQQKICEEIEQIDKLINVLDSKYDELSSIASSIKSKILDLAIRGKLVPQDQDDEPASVLLERIKSEKEELIKQGKIKRDKKESIIFKGDDNSYYIMFGESKESLDNWGISDLPNKWAVCTLGEICDYGNCIKVNAEKIEKNEWVLDLEDIEKDTGMVLKKVKNSERKSTSTKHKFFKGQVLYSKLRPYLNKVVFADDDGYCTSEILPLNLPNAIFPKYVRYYLMSPTFLKYTNKCSYGVKMPRLGTEDGKNAVFMLPPLAEQKRIVDAIETAFEHLDNILNNL